MAAKNTTGKAAGQAAALPVDIAKSVQELASDLDKLNGRLKYDFSPLLRALANLTSCHRVLSGIEAAASSDEAFSRRLYDATGGWRDPLDDDVPDLLADLARVTEQALGDCVGEADELARRAYGVSKQVREVSA